jgi:hypothetical protein
VSQLLTYDWITSTIGQVIHRIDHDRVELVRTKNFFGVIIYTTCGTRIAPMKTAILNDHDARAWADHIADSHLRTMYGPRRWCKECK